MSDNLNYEYPIFDQSNNIITEPDLTLGYLRKEYFTVHHGSIPEHWHYKVVSFKFSNGEKYIVENENDPHIEVIDSQEGIFKYKNLEGEEKQTVVSQTIAPVQDTPFTPAWDETKTIYRYVLYTTEELAQKNFVEAGPALLNEAQQTIQSLMSTVQEAQATIDDLLLVLADLIGVEDSEEIPTDESETPNDNSEEIPVDESETPTDPVDPTEPEESIE